MSIQRPSGAPSWKAGGQSYDERRSAQLPLPEGFVSRLVNTGDFTLHVVEGGPAEGRPVMLLHGFPEFWYAWHRLMPALSKAGYRVLAVDLPGYNLSDKPEPVSAYFLENVAGHIAALIETLALENLILAGHDWGGAAAWTVASMRTDLVSHLIAMNMPHPVLFVNAWQTPEQKKRSRYFYFFAQRDFASRVMGFYKGILHRKMLSALSKNRVPTSVLTHYGRMSSGQGLRHAMSYYAALLKRSPDDLLEQFEPLQIPVNIIWGDKDPAFRRDLAEPGKWAPKAETEYLRGVGHFTHLEAPERFEAAFFRAVKRT